MAIVQPAKILSQKAHIVPGKLAVVEHFFEVPLNYSNPSAGTLHLFARSARRHVVPADPDESVTSISSTSASALPSPSASSTNIPPPSSQTTTPPTTPPSQSKTPSQPPWLLYLQGGPGAPCSPPQSTAFTSTFIDKGYQLLLMDPRGTGLSSPVSSSTLGLRGDDLVQAAYLKHFRADSIVRDAEAIRLALTQNEKDERKRRWAILGQSFGGFCALNYLSMFPNGLKEVFLTGGLPPLVDSPDEVYKRLFKKVVERNQAYYEKFPEDVERVKFIVRFLKRGSIRTPNGGILLPRAFLQLGINFGKHGGLDGVHDTVLKCWTELQSVGHLTYGTLALIEQKLSWDESPIYSILHEPIYCQLKSSNWSAERVMRDKFRGFDPENTLDLKEQPTYFTGEMIFPFMFDDTNPELAKMKGPAHMLAADTTWPALYDRKQLAKNTVPVYAAVYVDDMYVDFGYSLETANAVKGCKTFITNAMYHNAIGAKTDKVIEELWKLRGDTMD